MATRCFPGPTRVLDANGISIASVVFTAFAKWQTNCETDRPRYLGTLQAAILVVGLCCIIHQRYLPLNLVARNWCQGNARRICVKMRCLVMYMSVLKLAIPDLFPVLNGVLLVLQGWASFSCLALFVLKLQTCDVDVRRDIAYRSCWKMENLLVI